MSGLSSIEWTERTLNPTTGCDRVSPGCDNCYAATMAKRVRGMERRRIAKGKLQPENARYQADGDPRTSGPGFGLTLHPETIDEPRRWRKPRLVFVNSMSDLFHAKVPYEFVEHVWLMMAETPRHTYQILTKRPDRMERFVSRLVERFGLLPNVWLGTSVESQAYVIRAERLLRVPAAVRFLSVEPLIGAVDLVGYLDYGWCPEHHFRWHECRSDNPLDWRDRGCDQQRIGWVIAGGESGHGARPCEADWLRSLRDQCQAAGVPYFLKQLGTVAGGGRGKGGHDQALLDGRLWREMPAVAS